MCLGTIPSFVLPPSVSTAIRIDGILTAGSTASREAILRTGLTTIACRSSKIRTKRRISLGVLITLYFIIVLLVVKEVITELMIMVMKGSAFKKLSR